MNTNGFVLAATLQGSQKMCPRICWTTPTVMGRDAKGLTQQQPVLNQCRGRNFRVASFGHVMGCFIGLVLETNIWKIAWK